MITAIDTTREPIPDTCDTNYVTRSDVHSDTAQ